MAASGTREELHLLSRVKAVALMKHGNQLAIADPSEQQRIGPGRLYHDDLGIQAFVR